MTETPKKGTTKNVKHSSLVVALAAFQSALPDIGLDKTNPHFRSKFASLANITREVFPRLAENGLAFSVGSFVDNGLLIVDAHLIHESGESRSMQIPITETNPQKIGSALSYYRRYSLASLTGIVADEDDDGNAASAPAPQALQKAQARKAPAKPSGDSARDKIRTEFIDKGVVDRDAVNRLTEAVKADKALTGNALYEEVLKRLNAGEVG